MSQPGVAEMNAGATLGVDVSQGEDDVCFICLDTSPSLIQSGCACRGAAGLAHPGCRGRAAEALVEQKRSIKWWWKCQTCEQYFTGEMRDGLANAWWSQVRDRAEDDEERLSAAVNLAGSLSHQGKCKEAEKMLQAVKKAGVANMVWYNYRRCPAVVLAKNIIDSGKLGQIFHYRANFLQDWTISADLPQGGAGLWRLDAKAAGSGVTGDLLAHCIDTALWLNGSIVDVSAMTETFIKQRKHTLTGKMQAVKIDDAAIFHGHFANGSLALFESTRYARGHKALYTLEINGANASIRWDLHDLHRLQYFDHSDEGIVRGWRSIHVSDGDQPYMKNWWVPGLQIGYAESFTHQVADFLKAAAAGQPLPPTFRDALETQYVCDAVLKSAKTKKWEKVKAVAKAKPAAKKAKK